MTTWTSWSVTNRARQLIALSSQMMIKINSVVGKNITSVRVILPSLCYTKWFLHHSCDHLTSVKSNDTFVPCFRALSIEAGNGILRRSSYSIEKIKSIDIRVKIEFLISCRKTLKIKRKPYHKCCMIFCKGFWLGCSKHTLVHYQNTQSHNNLLLPFHHSSNHIHIQL